MAINNSPIWFHCVDFPNNCPDECAHLVACDDVFATGDSPTGYECATNKTKDCPLYKDHCEKFHIKQ